MSEETITVRFLNHFGGGFAEKFTVRAGTTVGEFLQTHFNEERPASSFKIRVNRNPAGRDEVLTNDALVVLTPLKQEGA